MALTNAQRQAIYRNRKAQIGLIQVTTMLPAEQAARFRSIAAKIAAMLTENPDLEIGTLRNTRTGKLVSYRD